jgi:hypothetical protein
MLKRGNVENRAEGEVGEANVGTVGNVRKAGTSEIKRV